MGLADRSPQVGAGRASGIGGRINDSALPSARARGNTVPRARAAMHSQFSENKEVQRTSGAVEHMMDGMMDELSRAELV